MTLIKWNNSSTDCVEASSVNMFESSFDIYLHKGGLLIDANLLDFGRLF